jgi:glycosyltransferase involved in cell wall biosynthesis
VHQSTTKKHGKVMRKLKQLLKHRLKNILKVCLGFGYLIGSKTKMTKLITYPLRKASPRIYQKAKSAGKIQLMRREIQLQEKKIKEQLGISNTNTPHEQTTLYYYVDHTCQFQLNSGVQQVTRCLFMSILHDNISVTPIKWDLTKQQFRCLSINESSCLLKHYHVSDRIKENVFRQANEATICQSSINKAGSILLIPEVTHINHHQTDLTNTILNEANRLRFTTAFIFYDATPTIRPELSHMASKHQSYMRAILQADFIFPISDFSKEQLTSFAMDQAIDISNCIIKTTHLAYLPTDISSEKLEHNQNHDLPAEPFILSVGSITQHKNQLTLIKAFIDFKKENPKNNCKLVLCGNLSSELKQPTSKLIKNRSDVLIFEKKSNAFIGLAYSQCLFTVFPSTMEGFGLPIIESLYYNKPCITANFGAMAEVAGDKGCLLINTCKQTQLTEAITLLLLNKQVYTTKTTEAENRLIDNWDDYYKKIATTIFKEKPIVQNHQKTKTRLFWLGMHKILVKTELVRLRELGYEVFNPPYLSDIQDQSASKSWDKNQKTTLPAAIFNKLVEHNFFYNDNLPQGIIDILNSYFDAVIVTISPTWLNPILRHYRGPIIYRVYGQAHSLADEFEKLGLVKTIKQHKYFYFLPHALEAVHSEPAWLRKNETVIPYCLPDDVFGYANSWVGLEKHNQEVILSCPNIQNIFYAQHYHYLKQHFSDPCFKIYGVQLEDVKDPAVVGTLNRTDLLQSFRESMCYIYTYTDSRVCYLPPIEAMIIGLPVLFPAGCLLDQYFGENHSPARFTSIDHCKQLLAEIRSGNAQLVHDIIAAQQPIITRYKPSDVWPIFDIFFAYNNPGWHHEIQRNHALPSQSVNQSTDSIIAG